MELQGRLAELERAGYAVLGISYDSVATLARFAEQRGITFTLLSDEGSRTIRELGLLNEHQDEQHAFYGVPVADHQRGVAYPGIFVLDEAGTIVEKRFEQSYRVRPSGAALAAEVLGETSAVPAGAVRATGPGLSVTAWADPPVWRPYQELVLNLELRVEPGLHVYGEPIPDGYQPLRVRVEAEGAPVVAGPIELPPPKPFRMEGLEEGFVAYDGTVAGRLEVSVHAVQVQPITLQLRIEYQACSETACHPPAELRLAVPLEGQDVLRS